MRKTSSWALFFGAALMFVLSIVLHPLFGIVLAPTGLTMAVIVIVLDCFDKFNRVEQGIKWFIYSLLGIKCGQLYENTTIVYIATAIAVFLILVFVVQQARNYDNMLDDARKIDNF